MHTSLVRKSAVVAGLAAAALAFSPDSALAATVYTEKATSASSITVDANCSFVYNSKGQLAGMGCFKASGDKFYVRDYLADGHHVEMRGQINTNGNGFRCYETGGTAAGWQVCDSFWDNIPENAVLAWTASVWEGDDLLYSGQLKLSAA